MSSVIRKGGCPRYFQNLRKRRIPYKACTAMARTFKPVHPKKRFKSHGRITRPEYKRENESLDHIFGDLFSLHIELWLSK